MTSFGTMLSLSSTTRPFFSHDTFSNLFSSRELPGSIDHFFDFIYPQERDLFSSFFPPFFFAQLIFASLFFLSGRDECLQ